MKNIYLIIFGILILISSCKYTSQQNDMIKSLEESGVEIPDEVKEQQAFNVTDVLFPIGGILIFGMFVFMGIKQFKRKKAEFGYVLGDINEKVNSLKDNPDVSEKMTDEEKKNLDDVLNFLNKGTNN